MGCGRQLLREEATLRANRHDHRVLDLLCLHEAQHLRAVVLGTVRPAKAAAGHLAEAQMNAFDFDAIDEDLAEGSRFGQTFQLVRIELEGKHRAFALTIALLEEVGAQRRFDRVDVAAQDPVLVEALDVGQLAFERFQKLRLPALAGLVGKRGVEAVAEQVNQIRCDGRMLCQRFRHIGQRIDRPRLAQIGGIGAQHGCFPRIDACTENEAVEGVVVHGTGEGVEEGFLDQRTVLLHVEAHTLGHLQFHVVQDDRFLRLSVTAKLDVECPLADDAEAEVFEQRHAAGEGEMVAGVEDLKIKQGPVVTHHLVEL